MPQGAVYVKGTGLSAAVVRCAGSGEDSGVDWCRPFLTTGMVNRGRESFSERYVVKVVSSSLSAAM